MKNGELWLDNNGRHINAHGGSILEHEGVWYWYGEHKTEGWEGRLAWVGVHVYSSTNLEEWTDRGIALPVTDDPSSPICKGQRIERPKVIYCRKTGKFVMMFHSTDADHTLARCGVAVSDDPVGPFTFLYAERPEKDCWPLDVTEWEQDPQRIAESMPQDSGLEGYEWDLMVMKSSILGRDFHGGQMSRDMTLFVDDDQQAYHIYSSECNSSLHISRLTEDYLHHAGQYVRAAQHQWREAAVVFKHQETYCMVTSWCTSWAPNAAQGAVAKHIFGPWWNFGNPCTGVDPKVRMGGELTFGCQGAAAFNVNGKQYVMLDRWNKQNFMDSRYVWLPVIFHEETFEIPWQDECKPL